MSFKGQAIQPRPFLLLGRARSSAVAHNLQVVRNDGNNGNGWCNKSDAEIFEQSERWVLRCDLEYSKREALKVILLLLCGVALNT